METKDLNYAQLNALADESVIGLEFKGEFFFVTSIKQAEVDTEGNLAGDDGFFNVIYAEDSTDDYIEFTEVIEDNSKIYIQKEAIFVEASQYKGYIPSEIKEVGGFWREVDE